MMYTEAVSQNRNHSQVCTSFSIKKECQYMFHICGWIKIQSTHVYNVYMYCVIGVRTVTFIWFSLVDNDLISAEMLKSVFNWFFISWFPIKRNLKIRISFHLCMCEYKNIWTVSKSNSSSSSFSKTLPLPKSLIIV